MHVDFMHGISIWLCSRKLEKGIYLENNFVLIVEDDL